MAHRLMICAKCRESPFLRSSRCETSIIVWRTRADVPDRRYASRGRLKRTCRSALSVAEHAPGMSPLLVGGDVAIVHVGRARVTQQMRMPLDRIKALRFGRSLFGSHGLDSFQNSHRSSAGCRSKAVESLRFSFAN
jgi:hypothetical protein